MKIVALLLCALMLGGCLGKAGSSELTASSSRGGQGEDEQGQRAPHQMCEHTAIGGEPKSFCY